jgi:prevent-host-death family protein
MPRCLRVVHASKLTCPCTIVAIKVNLVYRLSFKAMEAVNIHQAKTHLSRLLSRVELGEEIVIANRGIPIAKLVPFRTSVDRQSSLGQDRGKFFVPDDFNAPLPEDILVSFEGVVE